jgi:hypothetical protein
MSPFEAVIVVILLFSFPAWIVSTLVKHDRKFRYAQKQAVIDARKKLEDKWRSGDRPEFFQNYGEVDLYKREKLQSQKSEPGEEPRIAQVVKKECEI